MGAGAASRSTDPVRMLTELARHVGKDDDPIVRQQLADVHMIDFIIKKVAQRGDDLRTHTGAERGAEGSILKLLGSRQNFRIAELAGELLGPSFAADTRGVGHLLVEPLPVRRAGDAHRRRHRRDPAQHPRRPRPRPAALTGRPSADDEREVSSSWATWYVAMIAGGIQVGGRPGGDAPSITNIRQPSSESDATNSRAPATPTAGSDGTGDGRHRQDGDEVARHRGRRVPAATRIRRPTVASSTSGPDDADRQPGRAPVVDEQEARRGRRRGPGGTPPGRARTTGRRRGGTRRRPSTAGGRGRTTPAPRRRPASASRRSPRAGRSPRASSAPRTGRGRAAG